MSLKKIAKNRQFIATKNVLQFKYIEMLYMFSVSFIQKIYGINMQ